MFAVNLHILHQLLVIQHGLSNFNSLAQLKNSTGTDDGSESSGFKMSMTSKEGPSTALLKVSASESSPSKNRIGKPSALAVGAFPCLFNSK
jgi:hypothetical protein